MKELLSTLLITVMFVISSYSFDKNYTYKKETKGDNVSITINFDSQSNSNTDEIFNLLSNKEGIEVKKESLNSILIVCSLKLEEEIIRPILSEKFRIKIK